MPTLRHENTIAQALKLYRRYQHNRDAYEGPSGASARVEWRQEFGEFCTRLNSYKTRIGLLQEARACGSAVNLSAWLSQCPGPLLAAGTDNTIEDAVRHLEDFLVHVGVITESATSQTTPSVNHAAEEPAPPTMSVDEAAEMLDVNRNTLYDAIDRGEIGGVRRIGRLIRIHRESFLEWLRQGEHGH
jgi:excisionase family DNA binding protein